MKTILKFIMIAGFITIGLKTLTAFKTIYAGLHDRYAVEAKGQALGFIIDHISN